LGNMKVPKNQNATDPSRRATPCHWYASLIKILVINEISLLWVSLIEGGVTKMITQNTLARVLEIAETCFHYLVFPFFFGH